MGCSLHRWHRCPAMGWIVKLWPLRAWAERSRERYNAEIDRQYKEAYERIPLNTPDAWGDLESFYEARRPR